MENNIRNAYKDLIRQTIINTINEGAVDEVTKAARSEHAKKAHEAIMAALDADKIVTIRARKQPRFEDPAVDVNLVKHQGQLMLVDPKGVAKPVHTIAPGDSGHITVHFKEKGGRATKPLHLHAGHGAIGDMIETEKDSSPYRVSMVGGKQVFKGLPDLSENYNVESYKANIYNRLDEAMFPLNKKKIDTIKTLAKGTLGGLALAGAFIGGHKMMSANQVQQQSTQPVAAIGSGQVKSQTTEAKPQGRFAHEMAARVIREREGFRSSAYRAPEGKWTIGYGNTTWSTGKSVQQGDNITKEQANKEFEHHIKTAVMPKLEKIPHWDKMSEHQKASLISFAYNVGEHFHGKKGYESITSALSSPDRWHEVPDAMSKYVKAKNPKTGQKETLPGLVKRRKYEGELWSGKEPELN